MKLRMKLRQILDQCSEWINNLQIIPVSLVYIALIATYMLLPDWLDIVRQIIEKFALVALLISYYLAVKWFLEFTEEHFGTAEPTDIRLDQEIDTDWTEEAH